MTIKLLHRPPTASDTQRPVSQWALRAAHALPLMLLPSCLWRLPFGFHFEMGQVQDGDLWPVWITLPYVLALSLLIEALALLCIGLVSRWGEVLPAWVPVTTVS